jgi:glycosyltransferase involved in cell wall biosynthesis
MRLAVDVLQLRRDHRGVGRYVRRLLAAMAEEAPHVEFLLAVRDDADGAVVRAELATGMLHAAERLRVLTPDAWSRSEADVAWYPWNFVRLRPASGAIVPTLHDLAPMLRTVDGRWWKVLKRLRAAQQYRHAVTLADHIITGSAVARDELVERLGVSASAISVVPHAADQFVRGADTAGARALLRSLEVTSPFVFALASRERRKNLGVLWAALEELHASGNALPLVLAGRARVALPARPWLHNAGFVSDEVLAALYAEALAVVVPSRYEGFGLPVLEAMAAGGVVVAANASTLPEVAGDAALFFPPHDGRALASCLARLAREPALRASLRTAGVIRAAGYTWRASARGTLAALERGRQAAAERGVHRQ